MQLLIAYSFGGECDVDQRPAACWGDHGPVVQHPQILPEQFLFKSTTSQQAVRYVTAQRPLFVTLTVP